MTKKYRLFKACKDFSLIQLSNYRIVIKQLEYAINADKSYVITYSQTNDYDYMEEYEASAETISLEFE